MAAMKLHFRVKTDFVLLAGDLDWGGGWMNLERAIRLLTQVVIIKTYLKANMRSCLLVLLPPLILFQGGLEVLGVGGGVRNSTGHWAVSCYQIELAYYMLSLQVQCIRYKN